MSAHIVMVIHYDTLDTYFACDYLSMEVIIDGKVVRDYGDNLHDRGLEKAEAFIDGFLCGKNKNWTPVTRKVADGAC